jgi:hypothetical protein
LPPASTPKKRPHLEPITYDEMLSNAGMSGFVSFLQFPSKEPAKPPEPARTAPNRRGRIRRAKMVEDGHSLAEQVIYDALWHAATPAEGDMLDGDRTIRIGYHRLANVTRLSWVSVKANLRSLEKKLAIEVTGSENSATREGKTYLVYSRQAILERRKRAGLEWVRRTRGVELLTQAEPLLQIAGGG